MSTPTYTPVLCPPGNPWLFGGTVQGVRVVEPHIEGELRPVGKAVTISHSVPGGSGRRTVNATLPVEPLIEALLDDPDAASAVLVAVARRLGALLA